METEVHKYMKKYKHQFAIDCGCDRCKEIIIEHNCELRVKLVEELINKFKLDYPKWPKELDELTDIQKKYASILGGKILKLYEEYPLIERLTFNKKGEMIKIIL